MSTSRGEVTAAAYDVFNENGPPAVRSSSPTHTLTPTMGKMSDTQIDLCSTKHQTNTPQVVKVIKNKGSLGKCLSPREAQVDNVISTGSLVVINVLLVRGRSKNLDPGGHRGTPPSLQPSCKLKF